MIKKIVNSLPEPLISVFNDTLVEQFYYNYLTGKIEFVDRKFSTECGQFTISIPAYANDWYSEKHEPKLNLALSQVLTTDSVFYDIGSQFGYHIQFAVTCGVTKSNIHSFEASTFRHAILQEQFSDVHLVNQRVSSEDSEDTLTINSYRELTQSPDVVKIDVEGAEGDVLEGMIDTLDDCTPVVFIEVHPELLTNFGYNTEEVYDILAELGYDIVITNHRNINSKWLKRNERDKLKSDTHLLRGRT